jgi:hypothetical protein
MSFVVLSQLESFILSLIRILLHLLADHDILVDHIVSGVLASEDPLLLVIVNFSQLAAVSSWLLLSSSFLVSLSMASDKALLLASLSMASDKALSMDIFMSGRPLQTDIQHCAFHFSLTPCTSCLFSCSLANHELFARQY